MKATIKKLVNMPERQHARFQILKHGFWFVDIPRTSSSSIRSELGENFGFPYGKKNVIEKQHAKSQVFKDHLRAKDMYDILGESIWKKIFTFTIVRNPWERIYSLYEYRKKVKRIPEDLSFRGYVMELDRIVTSGVFAKTLFRYPPHRYGASDFITDNDDQVIVDFVAKFENREHDLKLISERLGIANLGQLKVQSAASDAKKYLHYYDPETIKVIEKIYAKDIDLFGYEFG